MKREIIVGIKAASSFEQGYISGLMERFGLMIENRGSQWIEFSGKVGLLKATKILKFMRKTEYEFVIKGTKA